MLHSRLRFLSVCLIVMLLAYTGYTLLAAVFGFMFLWDSFESPRRHRTPSW